MSKNIYNQYFDLEGHLPGLVIFHKFEIFHNHFWHTGLKESLTKIMERDEALTTTYRACLFFIVFWWQKKNIAFKFLLTFNPWLLNSFDLPSYGSELKKRHTITLFSMWGEQFWKLFCQWEWGTNDLLGGKVCLGRTRGWRKLSKLAIKGASSKTISEESTNASCGLPTGCFLDTVYWITIQKKNAYFWICQ